MDAVTTTFNAVVAIVLMFGTVGFFTDVEAPDPMDKPASFVERIERTSPEPVVIVSCSPETCVGPPGPPPLVQYIETKSVLTPIADEERPKRATRDDESRAGRDVDTDEDDDDDDEDDDRATRKHKRGDD